MHLENEIVNEAFHRFKKIQNVSSEPDVTIDEVKNFLYRKLIKNKELYRFRELCKIEATNRRLQIKRHERIRNEQVPILLFKLECAYDLTMFLQSKLIEKIQQPQNKEYVECYLKDAGRTIGTKLYDLPAIQSGLYSVDAIKNIINNKSCLDRISGNTNEHFFSLYANAGPLLIKKAMANTLDFSQPKFELKDFIRSVSFLSQTIKTTRKENSQLQQYHNFNAMIDVKSSYENAQVSRLVNCGHDYESDVHVKWKYVCEDQGFDLKIEAGKHFKNILELDESVKMYSEIRNIKKYLPETLIPYRG